MQFATRNYAAAQLNGVLYAFGGYDYTNNLPDGANFNQRYDASTPSAAHADRDRHPADATNTRTPTVRPPRRRAPPPLTRRPADGCRRR